MCVLFLPPLCNNGPPRFWGCLLWVFFFCYFCLVIHCLALRKKKERKKKFSAVPRTFVCALALRDSGPELSPLSVPCSLPLPPFLCRLQGRRCPPWPGVGGRRAAVTVPAVSSTHCAAITGSFWEKPGPPAVQRPSGGRSDALPPEQVLSYLSGVNWNEPGGD